MKSRPLLVGTRSRVTRRALAVATARAVAHLRITGIQAGDRIGLCGDNTPEFVVTLLALARLDCSVALIDPRGFARAEDAVHATGLFRLVLPRPTQPRGSLEPWFAGVPAEVLLWTANLVDLPPGDVDAEHLAGSVEPDEKPVGLDGLTRWPWVDRLDGLVQLTSGSTGKPKVVAKRPADALTNASRTIDRVCYGPNDVFTPILPVGHQYGFSVLLIGLLLDQPVVLGAPGRILDTLRLGLRHGTTVVDTTPQAHDIILRARAADRLPRSVDRVKFWCVGGGPVPSVLQRRALRGHGRLLLDGYGSTELGNVAHVNPDEPGVLRPLDGVDVRVVDGDCAAVPAGTWGRLLVRTPDSPGAEHDTGDAAALLSDGGLVVAGRNEAVCRNGIVVYPAAVEHAVAVAGLNGVCVPLDGSRIVLVLDDRFRRAPGHWTEVIRGLLPPHLLPDRVVVRDSLPRTTVSGKVDRVRLARFVAALDGARISPEQGRKGFVGVHYPERVAGLKALLVHLRTHREDLVRLMSGYCAPDAAKLELVATERALGGALAELALVEPPCVASTWVHLPSNVVLYSYVLYLVIPSLFTTSLRARPSTRSTAATLALHKHLSSVHGLPVEVTDVTQADFLAERTGRPGTIVFTGRHPNAETVRGSLGPGQLMVFFGQGTNPVVVGADAETNQAAREAVMMRTLNGGQDCFGPDLHLVHRSVADTFVAQLVQRLPVSRGQERATEDPLVLRDVVAHVSGHRANVVAGGRIDLRELRVEPTVLRWAIGNVPPCSEVFAPVFNVAVYDEEDEVRELLDRPFYRERSMCASLYGTSDRLADWCAERMTVSLETSVVATDDPNQAFGGVGCIANYAATSSQQHVAPMLVSDAVARWYPVAEAAALGDRVRAVTQ